MVQRRVYPLTLIAVACALSFTFVGYAHAQTSQYPDAYGNCPQGAHPATAAEVPLMTAAGITNAQAGMCWNADDPNVGKDDAEAKQYLRSILCRPDGDNYGGMGPDGTIQGLDSKFAVCAASFLKTAMQGGQVCVKEGKRSTEKQEEYARRPIIACKKGALCEHPRGIAIDVNVVPSSGGCAPYQRLFSLAPQFGLKFYMGCKDAYHFVPAVGGCSAGGTAAGVGTNSPLPASNFDYPQYYAPQTSTPTSAIMNFLRNLLGPSQPQPLPYQQPQQYVPPTTPSSSTPYSSTGNTSGSNSAPSINDTSVSGTSGGTPRIIDIIGTTSGSSNAGLSGGGNDSLDVINGYASALAQPSSKTSSSGPASLNPNLQQYVQTTNTVDPHTGLPYTVTAVENPSAELAVNSPQTFPARPITMQNGTTYTPQQRSLLQQLFIQLQNGLRSLLNWLTPFGNRVQGR